MFWNCLTMFSLRRWGKSAETSIEIVLDYFSWSDEEIRLKQVLKLPDNNIVETTRKFGCDEFWNCLRMFSLKRWGTSAETSFEIVWQFFRWSDEETQLRRDLKLPYNVFVEAMRGFGWGKYWDCHRIFSLKWWGISAQTSFETVWHYFRWSDEEILLRRVLKLSYNVFVEAMSEFVWDKYWDCLRIFSLKWWRISAQSSFEIVWQCFLWTD